MDLLDDITAAVTVCDAQGTIVYMNDRSAEVFASDGGRALLGSNIYDCHPEPARSTLKELMESGRTNVYTIEKNGRRKIIFQSPCRGGMAEISFELPEEMRHFIRG